MKQKIYKVLSVMLTLAVILSTCICAIGTVSAANTVAPTMTQGTIDKGNVNTGVDTRIHTSEFLDVAGYASVSLASGYKAYYHYYDADQTWLGDCGGWKTDAAYTMEQVLGFTSTSPKYFKIVVGPQDANAKLSPATFPTNGLVLTLAGVQEEPPAEPSDATYFVSATGSDDNTGLTADKPLLTIKKAIELANESYGSDDTVVIKTVGSGAVAGGHADKASLPTYKFKKLVITANDTAVPGTINGNMQLGGETEFSYITVACTGNENGGNGFTFAGYSATFGENAHLGAEGSPNNASLGWNDNSSSKTSTAPTNVKINQLNYHSFYLSGNYYNSTTYNHPITIEIDNWNAQYRNEVNGGLFFSHGGSGTTLNAPINIKVDQSNIRLVFKSATAKISYGANFALQVINSTGKDIAKTGDTLTRNDSETAVHTSALDTMPEGKVYALTNNTGSKNAVEFTDTVGKYKVNLNPELFKIRAKAEGKEDVLSENGFLNLTAGEWTLTVEKEPNLFATYYVSPEGSDDADGKTINTPLASVDKAVQLANEVGYGVGDTIYVKVIHVADKSSKWAATDLITAHTFTLDISSNGDTAQLGAVDTGMTFNGPTKLSKIKMMWGKKDGSHHPVINFGGNDVVIGEGVSTTPLDYDLCYAFNGTLDNEHNLTFKGNYNKDLNLGGTWANRPTINGTVNVTYDGSAGYTFRIANRQGDNTLGAHATKINGTLNINLKSAAFVNLNFVNDIAQVRYGENSVVQVINSIGADSTAWDNALSTNKDLAKPSKYYILDNNIGWSNAVEFTDTAGKFKINVDTERFNILANNKLVEVTEGYATFEPGKYTLTLEVKNPYNETYFVKTGATGGNGEEATPFATVAEAIAAANAKGCVYGDNVTIKLVGEEAVVWGESEKFSFIPVVESANKEELTTVVIDTLLQGNVVFDYVVIDGGSKKELLANGNNVKLGANVQGDVKFIGAEKDATDKDGQTVEIDTAAIKTIYVGNVTQNNIIYKGDVNYIINNSAAKLLFNFMPHYGRDLTIDGNFNIKVVDAESLSFNNPIKEEAPDGVLAGKVVFESEDAGATLIVPADVKLNGIDNFKAVTDNHYIIKVGNGIDINATEYVDEYSAVFDETTYKLVVTDAQGNTEQANYSDGILTLYNPGEYTVELKCIEHVYDFECDNKCNRCEEVDETRVHKYTDEVDTTCDYGCGFVRTLGAQLIEEDGVTYYYYNGVKSTETGLVEYNGKTMYINKGRFLGASGLVTIGGKKLYIRNGYFLGASGLVTIGGKKLYIRNGYFLGASGLVTIDGKKVYIRNGYFLGATGLVTIDGKKLYIRNGYFLGATGIVTLDGKKLYIRNGYFLGASGTVTVGGKKYTVVNGIVK